MIQHCTVGNYNVSQLSGDGIKGVLLNVTITYDLYKRQYVECNKPFNTADEADSYCLTKGYIRVWSRDEVSK